MKTGRLFTAQEAELLSEMMRSRRDVRGNRFLNKPVEDAVLDALLCSALHAPSVGFSQPWELVIIREQGIKEQMKQSFSEENHKAVGCFSDEKQATYAKLKLEGIVEAPVNIAVFYKPSDEPVLGQTSMAQTGLFSVVCAVQNMWLTARSLNLGMGWVSILDPDRVKQILHAPANNQLVAYLCIGYVSEFLTQPELELLQWEKRKSMEKVVYHNRY